MNSKTTQKNRMWKNTQKKNNQQHNEFLTPLPNTQEEVDQGRRDFLQYMGASLAFTSTAAHAGWFRRPQNTIVAKASQPEYGIPAKQTLYATSSVICGTPFPMLATSIDGRPTRIDGNGRHPQYKNNATSPYGPSNAWVQAEILNLYDASRLTTCLENGQTVTRTTALEKLQQALNANKDTKGKDVVFVLPPMRSPTVDHLLKQVQDLYPKACLYEWDPTFQEHHKKIIGNLFSTPNPDLTYDFSQADVVLSLDCDFMGVEINNVQHANQLSKGREVDTNQNMNRLYVLEPHLSVTGGYADHRYSLRSSDIGPFFVELVREMLKQNLSIDPKVLDFINACHACSSQNMNTRLNKWKTCLAKDLMESKSLIVAGYRQPPWVHALAMAINISIGSLNHSVYVTQRNRPVNLCAWDGLHRALQDKPHTLVVIDSNIAYGSLEPLGPMIQKVPHSFCLTTHVHETAQMCKVCLPHTHFLETWGDMIDQQGRVHIQQPLIEPLFSDCVSTIEILSAITQKDTISPYEHVHTYWQTKWRSAEKWHYALSQGFMDHTPLQAAAWNPQTFSDLHTQAPHIRFSDPGHLHIELTLDNRMYDGRYASNPWLHEWADPITKLVWDNSALAHPLTLKQWKVRGRPVYGSYEVDKIKIKNTNTQLEAPVWECPGIPHNTIVIPLGYGRSFKGSKWTPIGFDASVLRSTSSPWVLTNCTWEKSPNKHTLVSVQEHGTLHAPFKDNRPDAVRNTSLDHISCPSKRHSRI